MPKNLVSTSEKILWWTGSILGITAFILILLWVTAYTWSYEGVKLSAMFAGEINRDIRTTEDWCLLTNPTCEKTGDYYICYVRFGLESEPKVCDRNCINEYWCFIQNKEPKCGRIFRICEERDE
jgi:hypothetical protein